MLKGYKTYPESVLKQQDKIYYLANKNLEKYLISNDEEFESRIDKISSLSIYKRTHANACQLRKLFQHLNPQPCGLKKSFGFGDRLGLATPGHVKALRGYDIFPVFAQQSIRELKRTNRTMEEVIDDAMWGVFQAGYKDSWGADIDHVKNEEDIVKAIDCGFAMFTIDSSDYLKNNDFVGAVKQIIEIYNLIKNKISSPFDFEVSIDETDTPTAHSDHIFLVEELRRNNVKLTSLALKFPGKFEKGIDYKGDLEIFKKEFLEHAAINKRYGGYKLSIHSGSDKFSIYPIIGKNAETFHVKTSGTSWLEAVRLISCKNPELFRAMYRAAYSNFDESHQTYQISIAPTDIPNLNDFIFKDIFELLDNNAARQLLHISYGILLENMKDKIYSMLNFWEEDYSYFLRDHFNKHLELLLQRCQN